MILCTPIVVLFIYRFGRSDRKALEPKSNFWNSLSKAFFLIYAVILLAVTIAVYFELNLVVYLTSMLVYGVIYSVLMTLMFRYYYGRTAQSA